MFEWLTAILVVILLLLWILDYLGLIEIVSEVLGLVLAAIVGTAKLVAYLIRKLLARVKPQP